MAPAISDWAMKTDHWFYGLFQSAPDLIMLLLPGAAAAPSLGADAPGDALYRFEAPELKAVNHRLDGVFWPRSAEAGTPDRPVVLLEVQMFSDPGFQHRLAAQSFRFLQQHPHVEHVALVVVTPHNRQRLGPARPPLPLAQFWQQVHALSLEELQASTQQIL
jgi:predicted transposase YdaD